jgi:MoaA/NifB/PqqE/SkfB family radical SAM enzyme
MSNFFEGGIAPLARSLLFKQHPLYVQFYITARCDLRCQQCNVIYANADQEECTTEQARTIAENLGRIGTNIVLLTGGEPFVRADIVQITEAMIQNGVHPRLQTNGLASYEQLDAMVRVGAHDISISLDSLRPALQDTINGGFEGTWMRAIDRIGYINRTFPKDSFCALGCVLAPSNIDQIVPIVEFATRIGWWVSLVPAHQTPTDNPRSFSSFDPTMVFDPEDYPRVRATLERVAALRAGGANLYDSDEYLADIYRFITRDPVRWRRRNDDLCDSPNLYFAIQPNGDMAVCCDYRLGTRYSVFDPAFPAWYSDRLMFEEASGVARSCSGCMYGSFPEITISARYFRPMLDRARLFLRGGPQRSLVPMTTDGLLELARETLERHGLTGSSVRG